ncbi:MAG: hypothetical protein DMG97_02235 [Acidobacteria bacterium]|nr:MAG: hypothetical protein DMG97_02235 [Acidobacteriota bacterium]
MTRRDAGQAAAIKTDELAVSEDRAAQINELNDCDIAALVSFFKLLDSWDREAKRNAKAM